MKTQIKAAFLAIVSAACAGSVFGQGQVTMGNNASSLVLLYPGGPPVPIGSTFFQLYFGPAGTPAANLLPLTPIGGTSAAIPGRIANTTIDVPQTGPFGVPAGGTATFQIWAWSSSFASYPLAASGGGWIAKSAVFNANTSPDAAGGPPPLPTSLAGLYPGFSYIPEPSTFVLPGLGLAALLLFHRRK